MRQPFLQELARAVILMGCCASAAICVPARGDQVEMVNGDRYVGHVLSLGSDTLVLQNEFLGTIKLPRTRIATISLEIQSAAAGTSTSRTPPLIRSNSVSRATQMGPTNVSHQFDAAISQLGANSNVISHVQQQFLAGAGPEAQAKFNDLVTGLLNGTVGVNELRSEAKNTLDQARSARNELGEEGGSSLDSYLAILESFLKETESTIEPTNAASGAVLTKSKAPSLRQEP